MWLVGRAGLAARLNELAVLWHTCVMARVNVQCQGRSMLCLRLGLRFATHEILYGWCVVHHVQLVIFNVFVGLVHLGLRHQQDEDTML